MPLLLFIILFLPGVAFAISVDDLVNEGIPLECLAWDNNWVIDPPTDPVPPPDPVEPPPDPVDPPPTDIGFDVGIQIDACDYDSASGLSVSQCPRRQAINGVGAYLQFNALDLRGAGCVRVFMPNEANRGITVRVDGVQVARLPSSGLVAADIAPLTCDTCTVQLYQDGSFSSVFVWLYWFEFLETCP